MANLTQSTQSTATVAPDYYTNYLSNLANTGTAAANAAQFVGPTALQNQAFNNVTGVGGAYQPELNAATQTQANAVNATSPLTAASNYLNAATQSPAQQASQYVSSYLMPAAQSLSDINQNNINMNLNPAVTAAATGSGQFGSSRAAQALGQADVLANQQTNSQIEQLLNSGYQNALTTAEQQNTLEGQLGSTAASAASQGQQNLTQAATEQGNLAAQNQNLGLADINAQATLGAQQQQIAQNQQLFPLTTLSTLSGLMSGQSVPTTTNTQLNTSPLSAVASLGSLTAALNTTPTGGGNTPWQNIMSGLGFNGYGSTNPYTASNPANGVVSDVESPSGFVNSQGQAVNADGSAFQGPVQGNQTTSGPDVGPPQNDTSNNDTSSSDTSSSDTSSDDDS